MKLSTLVLMGLLSIYGTLYANPVSINPVENADSSFCLKPDFPVDNAVEPSVVPDSMATVGKKVLAPTFIVSNDLCGQGIGAIDMTPDPTTPGPWLYMWSNGALTQDITGLTPGVYQVTVFDANNNFQIAQAVVQAGPNIGPQNITAVVTPNTLCGGPGNGALDVTVFPVLAGFTYAWSNGETTVDIANLIPGTYTISVTFGVTCTTTASFVVPNNTNAPVVGQASATPEVCETSNGTAGVLALGGVTPYTYEWSNGGASFNISGLTAGTYTVTITGANGCSNSATLTVGSADLPVDVMENVIVPNTTCNGANGSISINVNPPGPAYTFLWSNGATTQNLTNLPSGSYRVTVTRAGTCTATDVWYVENEPVLPGLSFINTNSSCGNPNGAVNLTPLPGGVPPYTYLWSNGATTQDLSNLLAGDYQVTLTSANGCTTTGSATVDDNATLFNYSAVVTDQTACDTINGKISLSLFPANLSYTWSNGATTTQLSNLAPGDYTVTVSAGGTCTAVETYSVGDVREYPVIPILPDTTTCGLSNGFIDLVVSGGITPYTYLWSTGATTQDLSGVKADTFYVTVTSAVGCATQNQVIVPNVNPPINTLGNVLDNLSCLAPTGGIDLNVTPLDTSYIYIWSSGETTDSLVNLTAGTYTVTVTLGLSCVALDTFIVANNALPPNLSASSTAAICDFSSGTASLDVSGGVAPFNYLWSNTATTEDLTGLAPGTYSVTVTGANSCTAVSSLTVPNNTVTLGVNGVPVQNTACGAGNGALDISINPPGTYNYLWSNTFTTEDINSLSPGSYTVTVSLGTCLSTATFNIADNALLPNVSVSGTAATCGFSNGSVDLSVGGGVGPFNYLWSETSTTEDLSGVSAGNFSVTVTGTNGCTAIGTANVANNSIALNVSAAPTGNSSCTTANGALDISVSPAGAYTYLWSNTATDEDLSGLASGNYGVTVSLGTCQTTGNFNVADNTATPTLTPNVTASICGASNGAIDLNISGGGTPYTFQWSNAETTEDLTALLPGNYTVTATAANGCTASATINVPNNASNFSVAGAPAPLTNCAANNGAVDLSISPAGAYTYQWSNLATTEDLSGLAPGTYTVSVTGGGACTATASFFVIDQRSNPTAAQSVVEELCGLSDGSIDLSVIGGATPFNYLWNSGQMTQDLAGISAGTYTVTVTDVNNCTTTASAVVPSNTISFALSGTFISNSSCIQNNGSIDVSVNPPGTYSYLWSTTATDEDLSGLNAGTYTVTVSAGGTCTNTATFNVSSNVPAPQIAQAITPAFCGDMAGGIDLSISGSPAPYDFIWSNSSTDEDLVGVLSGNYNVTVTASNGCTATSNYTVPENVFSPAIGSQLTPATSCVANNGAIDLTVGPAGTYTFQWSNMATTEDLNNVAAGNYTVTVSAGGTCTSTALLTVGSNTGMVSLTGATTAILCFGGNNGAVELSVTTGTAPFNYNWSNATTNEDLNAIPAGTYTVTVTDNLGCSSTSVFAVAQPASAVQIQCAAIDPVSQPGGNDGSGSVAINGGTGPYTVNWSPGSSQTPVPAGNFSIPNLAEAVYAVTVTDANGCPATCGFTVILANCATAVGSMGNSLITQCGTGCITATYNTTGQVLTNTDALQFVLHQGTGNQIVGEIARAAQPQFCFDPATMTYGTTYYISAVAGNPDASGNVVLSGFCAVASAGTPIRFNETPVASSNTPGPINCATAQTALNGSSNLSGSTYLWSTIGGTIVGNPAQANVAASATGTYNLVVTANGCSDTLAVQVNGNFTQPQTSISAASTALDCSVTTLTLNGTVTGAANAGTVWASNGTVLGTGNTLSVSSPGQYQFIAADPVSFCADTASITVTQSLNPPALSLSNPALLTCSAPSQTLTGSSTVSGVQFTWATINGTDTTIVGSGPSLAVSTPGTYYLFGANPANHCQNAISVNVQANQALPGADAGQPFTLDCAGETAPLSGSGTGAANLAFQWTSQDGHFVSGAGTATPLIDEAGTYSLVVTNPANGCTATDVVTILPEVPVAYASVLQPTCANLQGLVRVDSVTGLSDPILYSLNGSQPGTQAQFSNLSPGAYTLEVSGGNGCSASAVLTVQAPTLVNVSLTPDATIVLGYSYQLDAQLNIPDTSIASILWTPATGLDCSDCLTPLATPQTTTNYEILVVSNAGCEARGNVLITVDKTRHIYAPNIFSPDGNGTNDVFTIFGDPLNVVKIKSLQVYSRWGEAVYERLDFSPTDTNIGWDGTFKGQKMNPGVFVWQAVIQFVDGKEELFTGDVTLMR